ncbi:hypothetical protein H8959_007322, partial [Pygathrix nigripes]
SRDCSKKDGMGFWQNMIMVSFLGTEFPVPTGCSKSPLASHLWQLTVTSWDCICAERAINKCYGNLRTEQPIGSVTAMTVFFPLDTARLRLQ